MARAMEHQPALLLGCLDWHEPHIGPGDRFTNCLLVKQKRAGFCSPFFSLSCAGDQQTISHSSSDLKTRWISCRDLAVCSLISNALRVACNGHQPKGAIMAKRKKRGKLP